MAKDKTKLPKAFFVNWFRKSAEGKWLWPGYGDNIRVLSWIFDRCDGKGEAKETAIGFVPTETAIDCSGLKGVAENMKELTNVDKAAWLKEVETIKEHYSKFDSLPQEMNNQLNKLVDRLNK
jgi:phosphoenolpyruvate carboxykinase (GTP)